MHFLNREIKSTLNYLQNSHNLAMQLLSVLFLDIKPSSNRELFESEQMSLVN